MASEATNADARFVTRWVWATFLGWFLGFVLVVVLALLWDLVGGGAEFMVGVGIGAGVGFVQGRFLRTWIGSPARWAMASTVGMGALFVLHDLGVGVGFDAVPYSLPLYTVAGGLLTGVLQQRVLRPVSDRSGRWVIGATAGWSLPAGLLALGESGALPEPASTACSLGAMLLGGALVGFVSGPFLAATLRRPSS